MMIKKFGALLLSAVLCIGIAVPAFAFEGDTATVEQPVLPEVVEDVGGRLLHQLFGWQRPAVHHAGVEVWCDILSGNRPK